MIFNYFETEKKVIDSCSHLDTVKLPSSFQLLFFEHGVDEIPDEIIAEFSAKDVTQVDFSSNFLVSLDCEISPWHQSNKHSNVISTL
jgi:hypothetical protein